MRGAERGIRWSVASTALLVFVFVAHEYALRSLSYRVWESRVFAGEELLVTFGLFVAFLFVAMVLEVVALRRAFHSWRRSGPGPVGSLVWLAMNGLLLALISLSAFMWLRALFAVA